MDNRGISFQKLLGSMVWHLSCDDLYMIIYDLYIKICSWSGFFLGLDERANEGAPRGPCGRAYIFKQPLYVVVHILL